MGERTSRLNLYKPDSGETGWADKVNENWDDVDALKLDEMATPDDNTSLDTSTTAHGLCPKLSGNSGQYLNGIGEFNVPLSGGDVEAPATNTADNVPQWDGADSKTLKDGLTVGTGANNLVQLDGSIKMPAVDGSELTDLSGRMVFRDDDSSSADWTESTLTTDGDWHDLDCSSIVPAGATAILFKVIIMDNTANAAMNLKKKGNTYSTEGGQAYVPAYNRYAAGHYIIQCDSDRKIEYDFSNLTWTRIRIQVMGWFF